MVKNALDKDVRGLPHTSAQLERKSSAQGSGWNFSGFVQMIFTGHLEMWEKEKQEPTLGYWSLTLTCNCRGKKTVCRPCFLFFVIILFPGFL